MNKVPRKVWKKT